MTSSRHTVAERHRSWHTNRERFFLDVPPKKSEREMRIYSRPKNLHMYCCRNSPSTRLVIIQCPGGSPSQLYSSLLFFFSLFFDESFSKRESMKRKRVSLNFILFSFVWCVCVCVCVEEMKVFDDHGNSNSVCLIA